MENKFKLSSMRNEFGKTLVDLGGKKKDIVVLDADVSISTRTNRFAEKYPKRFFNVGISEQDLIGTGAGLAVSGKIPIVSTFAIFACRAWEQIRNTIGYANLNVKIIVTHGGLSNYSDGSSHQSLEDIGLMRAIPNMTIIVPTDSVEARKSVEASIDYPGPIYIRLGRDEVPTVFNEDYKYTIGKGVTLRKGKDISILTTGIMTSQALLAADILEKQGIQANIINIHTIKPLDEKIIVNAAKKTGRIITVEEHSIVGGLGSSVAEVLSEKYPVRIKRIGINDSFGTSSRDYFSLLKHFNLTPENIVKNVEVMVNEDN